MQASPLPLTFSFGVPVFKGERTEVVLFDGSKEIARQRVEPGRAAGERRITLTYIPEGSGTRRYSVTVDQLPGELTAANNRSAFVARVLRNRVRVLLIAGAPSPDVAVIGQTLREEKEYEVANLTQRADGTFVEGPVAPARLDSADVVVLVGYPGRGAGGSAWGMIREALRSRPLPLMVLLGKGSDPAKLAELSPRIPFVFEAYGSAEEYLTPHPVERERLHPLLSAAGGEEPVIWQRLPPLYRVAGSVRSRPEATVLIEAGAGGRPERDPFIVLRSVGGDRSIGIAGYGLWRWRLMVQEDDAARNVLGGFLSASMKWLTSPDDAKPFRIRQVREIVPAGEPIGLTAETYDAAARPLDGVRVVATLLRPTGDLMTEFRPIGNGRYEGGFDGLPEGEYRVTASAEVNGGVFARDDVRVIVGGAGREMRDTRPDHGLLRSLAAKTGGVVVGPEGLASLDSALSAQPGFGPRRVERSSEYRLQSLAAVLGMLVLLLIAEWVLRRRAGML